MTEDVHASDAMLPKLTGVAPIAPTPFSDGGDVDYEGQRRVIDCMVDQRVDAICILANYSEQFALTDSERRAILDTCLDQVAGRVPVIVTVSHFSTRIASERARDAAMSGASMLMLMPPYHGATLRADEAQVIEHFAAVAEASGLPIMVQDAPMAGTPLSVPFLLRLGAAVPLVRAFKVEVAGAASKLRALVEVGGPAISEPFDGEESVTLMADLDAGATGTMPSAMIPDLIRPIVQAHLSGDRASAKSSYARLLPLINYENRQCGLRATKAVFKAGGVIASDAVRHPLSPLHPATHAGLMELAREVNPLALRWGR
jgi:2-keto-3-deoxy-L-arabinonate dehydratase